MNFMNLASIPRARHAVPLLLLIAGLAFGAEEKKAESEAKEGETVQTPFGPAKKQEAAPKPAPRAITSKPLVDVSLQGDTYTFTRQTPFGAQSWKRAKADLSDAEKKLIADQEAWEKHEAEEAKPEPKPAAPPKSQS
jgi:hypothetical protein